MIDLNELADLCAIAEGPDRTLDAAIFRALDMPVPTEFASMKIALTFDEARNAFFQEVGDMVIRYEPPRYTGSLDAAASLVPEDKGFVVGCGRVAGDEPLGGALITPSRTHPFSRDAEPIAVGEGETAELALCAAALRAKAEA